MHMISNFRSNLRMWEFEEDLIARTFAACDEVRVTSHNWEKSRSCSVNRGFLIQTAIFTLQKRNAHTVTVAQ